ncbi:MAG: sulfurtransferase [Clostridia bacterium]|jgi:thiosulfate/3-mercaptopyruvate sulfurtransferase|nr:rhodanese-like domain-containing protein [Spirochaetia bacterium]
MKKFVLILLIVALAAPVFARGIDPVVSAEWLEANLDNVVVVDMRKIDEYKAGHVPGAVSLLGLYVPMAGLSNEVPEADELSELLAEAGIDAKSKVVVVETDGARFAWATRAAWTLVYAGVADVAVLDGGFAAWTKASKRVATGLEFKDETDFEVKFVPGYFADKAYVLKNLKSAQIVDVRAYDNYFGVTKQGFVEQFGHIPGAMMLPASWIVGADGLVKAKAELEAMVAAQRISNRQEMVIHCDSGVLATAWWWILTQQLGWTNVRSYDGSAQEISKDPTVKFVKYVWR